MYIKFNVRSFTGKRENSTSDHSQEKGCLTFDDMDLHLSEDKFYRLNIVYCSLQQLRYLQWNLIPRHMEPSENDVKKLFKKLDMDNDHVIKESALFSSYLCLILEEDEINNFIKSLGL